MTRLSWTSRTSWTDGDGQTAAQPQSEKLSDLSSRCVTSLSECQDEERGGEGRREEESCREARQPGPSLQPSAGLSSCCSQDDSLLSSSTSSRMVCIFLHIWDGKMIFNKQTRHQWLDCGTLRQ